MRRACGRQPAAAAAVEVEQQLAVELGAAAVGAQRAGQDRQQGGLAGAVGSEHGEPFAGGEVQVDVEAAGGDLARSR